MRVYRIAFLIYSAILSTSDAQSLVVDGHGSIGSGSERHGQDATNKRLSLQDYASSKSPGQQIDATTRSNKTDKGGAAQSPIEKVAHKMASWFAPMLVLVFVISFELGRCRRKSLEKQDRAKIY